MIIKTLLLAAFGGALWKLGTLHQQRQGARRGITSDRKPHAENLWEGEGGALRESGAQLGPEPKIVLPA